MADYKQQIQGRIGTTTSTAGNYESPALTKRTELITADWRTNLVMEGLCYRVTVGTITGGGALSPVTGGGNGTTVDQDQPELAIGVGLGYYLVPLEIRVALRCVVDTNADTADIIVAASRTEAVPADGTKTTETPLNMLDGGPSFPGVAYSAYTADLTDYTVDELLAVESISGNDAGTAGNINSPIVRLDYSPVIPEFIAGPCGLYVHWGGTQAQTGTCTAIVAAVPTSYL